jgi:hypothetical protein
MIMKTYDGGDSWIVSLDGLSAPLNSIYFKDGFGFAVGGNGLVLKTEDGTTWIDAKTNKVYPSQYHLSQNYPNPFNPSTTIEFSLSQSSFVSLKVYNILGKEVATLVSKTLTIGKYKYEWNAGNFASGIYIYTLKAGSFEQSCKMLLLR